MSKLVLSSLLLVAAIMALTMTAFGPLSPEANEHSIALPVGRRLLPRAAYLGRWVSMKDDDIVQVKVHGVLSRPDLASSAVVLLNEDETRMLPIFIGELEAVAILRNLNNIETPRPMTHDLLLSVMEKVGAKVSRVVVTHLHEGTFYASMELRLADGNSAVIDARPSDSIAVALKAKADLFVSEAVFDDAGQDMPDHEDDAPALPPLPEAPRYPI